MANFGSFEYGTGVTYGPPGSTIASIDVLDRNIIIIEFNDFVIIDEDLLNPANYQIEFTDNPGFTDVESRKVLPYIGGVATNVEGKTQQIPVVTTQIQLVTDYHSPGTSYTVTISNLNAVDGSGVPLEPTVAIGRRTKTEEILKHMPRHYDNTPQSLVRGILTAMAIEDDRIGGSLKEPIP